MRSDLFRDFDYIRRVRQLARKRYMKRYMLENEQILKKFM